MDEFAASDYEFMRPLKAAWESKINLSKTHPKRVDWQDVSDQCMSFYTGAIDYCFRPEFMTKYFGGQVNTRFRIAMAKAFEVVAIYGPLLFDHNPSRSVQPYKPVPFGPEVFGDLNDPNVQQIYEQAQARQAQQFAIKAVRARLMQEYLSYTPREQPGGLRQHSEDAITEMLVKGRGVLWPAVYSNPGSRRRLTGLFFDSADRFYSDPDARTINFGDTRWVSRELLLPTWDWERRFNLQPGTLQGRGTLESAEVQALNRISRDPTLRREMGTTFDLLRGYEIWSIGGLARVCPDADEKLKFLDKTVGDYSYLVVAEGVPYPLNCPPEMLRTAMPEDIRRAFSWPCPHWLDHRWPMCLLDAYREPNNPWPIALLKPALTELTAINLLLSFVLNHAWAGSKTILAILESAYSTIAEAVNKDANTPFVTVKLKEIHGDIRKVIQEFHHQDVSPQIFTIIEKLLQIFAERTGLYEALYATNPGGAASRSAADASQKAEKASIRPEHLSKKVDDWMEEAARAEKLTAYFAGISGSDLRPRLGDVGAYLWDQYVLQADPEEIIYEMDATVEPSSTKRPNKQKDAANLAQIYQTMSSELGQYAAVTGDTGPLNRLNQKVFDAIELDGDGLQMGPMAPPQPPPSPEPPPPSPEQLKFQFMQEQGQQKLMQREQQNQQKLVQREQQHQQKMQHDASAERLKLVGMIASERLKRIKQVLPSNGNGRAPVGGTV